MLHLEMEKLKRKIMVHRFAIVFCLVAAGFFLLLTAGKVAYIMVDSTEQPVRTFKPGIKVLTTTMIPDPLYEYSQPYSAQVLCVDGCKYLVLGGFSATRVDGECE